MRRHMQNISFVAIIATLLSCAFFFSQQTKTDGADEPTADDIDAKALKVESLDDVPDCASEVDIAASLACYTQAEEASSSLLDAKVDEILSYEPDSGRRMDFMESQLAWEKARDADCAYMRAMVTDPDQQDLQEMTCLNDHNLDRVDALNEMLCQFYEVSPCPETANP